MKRMNKIILVAGIHGVGKTTLTNQMHKDTNINVYTASELLKWKEQHGKNKLVPQIDRNQERLTDAISKIQDAVYILDGHLSLCDSEGILKRISMDFFTEISPSAIILVNEKSEVVLNRLIERDKLDCWTLELIKQFLKTEHTYALEICNELDIPLIVYDNEQNNNYNQILELCKTLTK